MSLLLFIGSLLALEGILRFKPAPVMKTKPLNAADSSADAMAGQLLNVARALEQGRGVKPSADVTQPAAVTQNVVD